MVLLNEFIDYIRDQHLFQKKDLLILAVSGGVDSVVMADLCSKAGFDFKIAHCNFQLRQQESELDEALVSTLRNQYHKELFIKKFETQQYADEQKLSIQVAARELRYEWFTELISQERSAITQGRGVFLATAHHLNDNIETLLMNFFKGTGIKGLGGIPPKNHSIVRPLLFAKKEAILEYADQNHLPFREDASNRTDKYTRNYFRNTLIPSIQKVFPAAETNLENNLKRFTDVRNLYSQAVDYHKKRLMETRGGEVHIPVLKLLKSEPVETILYEIISPYGFTSHQVAEAMQLLKSESGKFISSPTHRLIHNRNWMILAPNETYLAETALVGSGDREVALPDGKLAFGLHSGEIHLKQGDPNIALVDGAAIHFPLIVRKWKSGDYFYPLGLKKPSGSPAKKKLSRFFIDQKLSVTDKEKIRVIESDKRIVWVIGLRLDERFKVKDSSEKVIRIHFTAL